MFSFLYSKYTFKELFKNGGIQQSLFKTISNQHFVNRYFHHSFMDNHTQILHCGTQYLYAASCIKNSGQTPKNRRFFRLQKTDHSTLAKYLTENPPKAFLQTTLQTINHEEAQQDGRIVHINHVEILKAVFTPTKTYYKFKATTEEGTTAIIPDDFPKYTKHQRHYSLQQCYCSASPFTFF